jgi:hypothetical protein
MRTLDQGKYSNGTGLWSHNKARAQKGGVRIVKKPKKATVTFDVLNAEEVMQKL